MFFLAYPLLLALVIAPICAVFVYAAIPLLKAIGVPLAGVAAGDVKGTIMERHLKMAKETLKQKLPRIGLQWRELEGAGVLKGQSLQAFRRAARRPREGMECLVLASPALAVKAVITAAREPHAETDRILGAHNLNIDGLAAHVHSRGHRPSKRAAAADLQGFLAEAAQTEAAARHWEHEAEETPCAAAPQAAAALDEGPEEQSSQEALGQLGRRTRGLFTERPRPRALPRQCAPILLATTHNMCPLFLELSA